MLMFYRHYPHTAVEPYRIDAMFRQVVAFSTIILIQSFWWSTFSPIARNPSTLRTDITTLAFRTKLVVLCCPSLMFSVYCSTNGFLGFSSFTETFPSPNYDSVYFDNYTNSSTLFPYPHLDFRFKQTNRTINAFSNTF